MEAVRVRARGQVVPSLVEVFTYAMAGAPVPTEAVYESGGRFGTDLPWAMWSWSQLCAAERAVAGIVLDFSPELPRRARRRVRHQGPGVTQRRRLGLVQAHHGRLPAAK